MHGFPVASSFRSPVADGLLGLPSGTAFWMTLRCQEWALILAVAALGMARAPSGAGLVPAALVLHVAIGFAQASREIGWRLGTEPDEPPGLRFLVLLGQMLSIPLGVLQPVLVAFLGIHLFLAGWGFLIG